MITPLSKFQCKEDIVGLLDDDSKLSIPICHNILFLSYKMLDPEEDKYVIFEQNEAPIAGLFHKQVRFFKNYIQSYESNNPDMCYLLNRIIYEAYIKMRYLIDNPQDIKEYRSLSFKTHVEILNDPILSRTPNATVLKSKFEKAIDVEGLSIDDIKRARRHPGGKNFRQMQEIYEHPALYSPIYSATSDAIHSGWNEIRQMYLRCDEENKQYVVDIEYSQVLHFRMLITIAGIMVDSATVYYQWLTDHFPVTMPGLQSMLKELKRICLLIAEIAIDTYKDNPNEYMYK